MSIVRLVKITVYGVLEKKEEILSDLQDKGCLHLIPLRTETEFRLEKSASPQSREALKFLLGCPHLRRQVRDPSAFNAEEVEKKALELQRRIQDHEDERDYLNRRITDLTPWGEFSFPPLDERNNLLLWFFMVPHHELKKVEETGVIFEVVGKDNRYLYVVVISEQEPRGMPVARTHTGNKPISKLRERLEEVELELEDLQAEREHLTRWCTLFARSIYRLEDQAVRSAAANQTFDATPLFALQGWAPREAVESLTHYSNEKNLVLEVENPKPGEKLPTLFRNRPALSVGEDLVSFYMTPSYWLWDPSSIVLFSFSVFFAMILSDAGYALLLGIGLFWGWKRFGLSEKGKRLRVLFSSLVISAAIWGIAVGSYFGLTPSDNTILGILKIIDLNDSQRMMQLSIFIGIAHLAFANFQNAMRFGFNWAALAPMGWVGLLLGGGLLWIGSKGEGSKEVFEAVGIGLMGAGAILVLFFTSEEPHLGRRVLNGLLGLTKITSAFGDVLSYLRLFALGLASASLALTFNDLASQIRDGVPGLGLFLAMLVILIGHGINLLLSIVSGFVHGLRLNFIEFFNWGVPEEGQPFQAFSRKEKSSWNHGFSH